MPAIVPAFSNNIPLPANEPSADQPLIRDNFDGINQIWDINHFAFADANAGKHRFSSMVLQGVRPGAVNNEFQIYMFNNATSTHDELYIRRSLNNTRSASARVPFTARGGSWTWLPSGLLVKWGNFNRTVAQGTPANVNLDHPYAAGPTIQPFVGPPLYVSVTASAVAQFGLPGTDPDAVAYFVGSTFDILTYRLMRRTVVLGNIQRTINVRWLAIGSGIA